MDHTLLIIDDSPAERQEILSILRHAGLFKQVFEASGVLPGFKLANAHPVDVVICDLEMPGMDGTKFLAMIAGREKLRDLPVILLTGREDPATKIRCLEQGASDYVTKPFDPGELIARVKVQLKIKTLQDSLKESNRRLTELSNTDPLTGLYNRRCLMRSLEKELQRSRRSDISFALVLLDIDHFKQVNDTYGHQKGDHVLQEIAELLRGNLRPYDLAARFGGEEFALVLAPATLDKAVQVANRIRETARHMRFDPELQIGELTLSLGVAVFPGFGIQSLDGLIQKTDEALYRAKRKGRNQVAVAN